MAGESGVGDDGLKGRMWGGADDVLYTAKAYEKEC